MQPSAKQGRLEWTTISSLRVFIAMQVTPFVVLIKPMLVAGFGDTKVPYKVVAVYRGVGDSPGLSVLPAYPTVLWGINILFASRGGSSSFICE